MDEDTDIDPFDEIEAKMKAWGDPIADQLVSEAFMHGISFPVGVTEAEAREGASTLIAGLAALNLAESLKLILPRTQHETGSGTIRFQRDATGELCVTVDGIESPLGRMSVSEMYAAEFERNGFAQPLPKRAAELVEEAFLQGRAYLMSFIYDAAASTSESAVYQWKPPAEELEEINERWNSHDEVMGELQARRELRGARIDAKLADAGLALPAFLKDGLTEVDLALALDLLGARLATYLNDERCESLIYLRPDGSVRIDSKSEVIVPPEATSDWLAKAFAEAKPEGLAIAPADLLDWCRACVQVLGTDLFEDMHACAVPEGMAVTFTR